MSKSSTFVRSWIGFDNAFYGRLFHDCYISTEPKTIHIILKKYEDITEVEEAKIEALRDNHLFKSEEEYHGNLIMNFDVPEDKIGDIDSFLSGSYSKLSDSAKELIIMSHSNMKNIKNLAIILYPQREHRDKLSKILDYELPENAEIHDKPVLEEELFSKDKL